VRAAFTSNTSYTHSSYTKTLQEILGVPVDARVQDANDFSDFFTAGQFP
jgi:hypothetical protein